MFTSWACLGPFSKQGGMKDAGRDNVRIAAT